MSRLEKLPPEIRSMIYFLVLISPTGYIEPISRNHAYYLRLPGSTSRSGPHWYLAATSPSQHTTLDEKLSQRRTQLARGDRDPPEISPHISTSLLRTNKNIYQEMFPVFWEKNTFIFGNMDGIKQFQRGVGHMAFGNIKSINITIHHRIMGFEDVLTSLVNLKKASNSNSNEKKVFKCEMKKLEIGLSKGVLKWMLDQKDAFNSPLSWVEREELYRGSLERLESAVKKCREVGIEGDALVVLGDMRGEQIMRYKDMISDLEEVFGANLKFDEPTGGREADR
ncbi:hypothetical protein BDZ45DRAFT_769818 [Acephala macrosclerotiorum]|nr:hypothetical protein BDZ45DRAFT_769818 [Acephala macrosclerotiorum]